MPSNKAIKATVNSRGGVLQELVATAPYLFRWED